MKVMLNIVKKRKEEDEGREKKIVVDGSLLDIMDLQNRTVSFWKNRSKG